MLLKTISALLLAVLFSSCSETGLYEKVSFMPEQQWPRSYQPECSFEVKDTTSSYRIYFLFRHDDGYAYNNLWVKLHSRLPGDSTERVEQFEIPLANETRWLGTGMADIFDHRVLLYPQPVRFSRMGIYSVQLEHNMRVDPLKHVLNAGLRVEKVK